MKLRNVNEIFIIMIIIDLNYQNEHEG